MKAVNPPPLLIVVSGPSGSGKGVALQFLTECGLEKVVTYTTRQPRPGEMDKVHYNFISEEEFVILDRQGHFLEYNRTYYRDIYASPAEVLSFSDETRNQVMELDPEGYFFVKTNSLRKVVGLFVLPPNLAELQYRITNRSENSEEELKRRIALAKRQIMNAWMYDYVVSNDEIDNFTGSLSKLADTLLSHQRSLELLGKLVKDIRENG
jgi:guanylate kinase